MGHGLKAMLDNDRVRFLDTCRCDDPFSQLSDAGERLHEVKGKLHKHLQRFRAFHLQGERPTSRDTYTLSGKFNRHNKLVRGQNDDMAIAAMMLPYQWSVLRGQRMPFWDYGAHPVELD